LKKYPYERPDAFKNPERYEFAKCEGQSFLDAWKESRDNAITRIVREAKTEGCLLTEKKSIPEGVSLESLLTTAINNMENYSTTLDDGRKTIDALLSKFEIFRRLFSFYTPSLNKAIGSSVASISELVLFGQALSIATRVFEEPQYLSTLLKLTDALCAIPANYYTPSVAEKLAQLIKVEKQLVATWEIKTR